MLLVVFSGIFFNDLVRLTFMMSGVFRRRDPFSTESQFSGCFHAVFSEAEVRLHAVMFLIHKADSRALGLTGTGPVSDSPDLLMNFQPADNVHTVFFGMFYQPVNIANEKRSCVSS